jgi:hypothetical protein
MNVCASFADLMGLNARGANPTTSKSAACISANANGSAIIATPVAATLGDLTNSMFVHPHQPLRK